MSATVDRMEEIIAATVPVPFDPSVLPHLPYYPELFTAVHSLGQAWPLVRDEMASLESTVVALSRENTQFRAEHERLTAGIADLTFSLTDCRERRARESAEAQAQIATLTTELAAAAETVRNLPVRHAAADAVCRSLDQSRQGSGGAFAHYDGEAYDAWKAAL